MEFLEKREYLSFCLCGFSERMEKAKEKFSIVVVENEENFLYLKTRYSVLPDGKKHGKEFVWCDGKLQSETEYKDGEIHGKKFIWYKSGKMESAAKYKKGKMGIMESFPEGSDSKPMFVKRDE